MKLYLVNDLMDRLETIPFKKNKGWVRYKRDTVTKILRSDYLNKKEFQIKKPWNTEIPMVWGFSIDENYNSIPNYVEDFLKNSNLNKSGGKCPIVMNQSYFDNAYYGIESRYFAKSNSHDLHTRNEISKIIKPSIQKKDKSSLRASIYHILMDYFYKINNNIKNMNDLQKEHLDYLKIKLNFIINSYIKKTIDIPQYHRELIEKSIIEHSLQYKYFSNSKIAFYIDSDIQLFNNNSYSLEEKIDYITDRILAREKDYLKKYRKYYTKFNQQCYEYSILDSKLRSEMREILNKNNSKAFNSFLYDFANNSRYI